MLASSSRHALNTTRSASRTVLDACCAHGSSSGSTGIQQQRHVATTQAGAKPIFRREGGEEHRTGLRHRPYAYEPDSHFRRVGGTAVARFNMELARDIDRRAFARVFYLCKSMKERGEKPDVATYTHIFTACARLGLEQEAQAAFEDMLANGVQPNRQIFHEILYACRFQETSLSLDIIKLMEKYKISPNETTYEILITRYVGVQQLELALQCLSSMSDLGLSPTVNAAQAVIRSASALGFPRLALDLAESFEEASVRRLHGEVWTDVLRSCANSLWAEGVERTWKKVIHELNVTPDEGLCCLVLNTVARHGMSALGLDVLRILGRIGVIWKEHHFSPIIEALCKEKNIRDALGTLEMMRSHNITPVPETTYPISAAISSDADAVDQAWAHLMGLHDEGKRVDVTALNVIIRASVALGDLQRALGTYKAAGSLDVAPDVETFNLLLSGCIDAQHRKLGDRLLSEMKEAGVKPDARTYERLIVLSLTQPIYEDAFFYLEEMKAEGHTPPRAAYVAIIRKCVQLGDTRYKLAVEEMLECKHEMSEGLQTFIDSGGERDVPDAAVVYRNPSLNSKGLARKREEFLKGVQNASQLEKHEEKPDFD